ncbi:alpha/beta hydrolase [Psychrobacter sp. FDAARGOS_221]|uniref:alpha/beta hydrolase n=1 Tax=Psychrobacter sp. FDAARGOS_221 TaxID=1975705 RepID=UPI000BB59F87|nr:dienelactone hydrolase family protein [Psychrobacter sp. FDAARGOS_221]PNK61727.1 carboxylesterase [Psychrobacter sp. FDAARGOS_221]
MTTYLDCVIVEHNPQNKAIDKAVIWLHGLGASGHDFEPVVPELGLNSELAVRFVFPHAPRIPVTINGGMVMPAWYDILEMSLERKVDVEQIQKSAAAINDLIQREVDRGVSPDNIVIAGFSQGGAIAYQVALTHPQKLAGLLTLSTYLAIDDSANFSDANKTLPVKIDHGTQDPVVPVQLGQRATESLKQLGYDVDFTTYPMAHQVCMPQIKSIGNWLNTVLT